MARTKQAARRRNNMKIEDIPIPANHVTPEQQEDLTASDDDAMELEIDGGVSLDLDDATLDYSNLSSSNHDKMVAMYHQTPISELQDTSDLWRLPVTPLYTNRSALRRTGINNNVALLYHNSCRLIWNHWRCEPTVCIPDDLRKQTPYSLAMLSQLRVLASHTKQNFAMAQSLLMEAWRARFHTLTLPGEHTSLHIVETVVTDFRPCEHTIQENGLGLMLGDVEQALGVLREYRHDGRQQAKNKPQQRQQGRGAQTQKKQARLERRREAKLAWQESARSDVADKVTKRRREEKAAKNPLHNPEQLQDMKMSTGDPTHLISIAPPNSPVLASSSTVPLSQRGVTLHDQTNGEPRTQRSDGAVGHFSTNGPNNENQYNHMSGLLNKMGMDRTTRSGRRRVKRLKAGGLSRLGQQPVTLPSERVNLNTLPTLHDMASTSAFDLARMGQLALTD